MITKMCKVFGTHPRLTISFLRLMHAPLIYFAFVKRGVVTALGHEWFSSGGSANCGVGTGIGRKLALEVSHVHFHVTFRLLRNTMK